MSIEIEYSPLVRRQVSELFRRADEWYPFPSPRGSKLEPYQKLHGDVADVLRYNFSVTYRHKHRHMEGLENIEYAVIKVHKDIYHEVACEIGHQVSMLNHLLQPYDASDEARRLQHTSRTRRRRVADRDADNGNLVSFVLEHVPVEGDENHVYLGIFIHSELKRLTTAHLLQQEKRAMGA